MVARRDGVRLEDGRALRRRVGDGALEQRRGEPCRFAAGATAKQTSDHTGSSSTRASDGECSSRSKVSRGPSRHQPTGTPSA